MTAEVRQARHHLSILGIRDDDGEWSAVALEMDVWGYGTTWGEALEELKGVVEAQIHGARDRDNSDLLDFPAEQKYWDLYRDAQMADLRRWAGASAGDVDPGTLPLIPALLDLENRDAV